ncbi:MAG: hypothetical protein MR727_09210 [Lentisphaeria bacterium]|nr:hypothetical protein [Lentisphaeria bacterium]
MSNCRQQIPVQIKFSIRYSGIILWFHQRETAFTEVAQHRSGCSPEQPERTTRFGRFFAGQQRFFTFSASFSQKKAKKTYYFKK